MKRIDYLEFTSLMEAFGITDPRFILSDPFIRS